MTLFKKAAKPVCEELVTVTTTEVSNRIDGAANDIFPVLEIGVMAITLIASFVLPHNPLVHAARSLLAVPRGVDILEISRF